MTGTLRYLLQSHFSVSTNFEFPALATKIWTNDAASTPILIESGLRYTPTKVGKRPALMIHAGKWNWKRMAIGQAQYIGTTGTNLYSKQGFGSHIIGCYSPDEGEGECLAAEVYRFLMHYGPVFIQRCALLGFEVEEMSEPTIAPEHQEMIKIAVGMTYSWEESWSITQASTQLRQPILSIN